jgi:myo-inositol 2-dehydrogenase / D-chiro-inositol 1-dehydrogenase
MTKVGIIGLGRMGMLHLKNCMKIEGVTVEAVADSSKTALKKAQALGVKNSYSDYLELLKHGSDLDAVVLSMPNFMHFESIKNALESGLNIFAEKPMANTVDECKEVVRLVDKSGKKLMVGHCMRYVPALVQMRKGVEEGSIGNLEVATIEEIINGPFAHPRNPAPVSDWWFDPVKSGGGALLDVGYHMIDLFRFLVGDATVSYASLDHKFNLDVEDGAIVMLQSSETSAKGIINVGWYEKTIFPQYDFRVILHGSSGYASSDDLVPHNLYRHAVKEGMKNILGRAVGRKLRPLSYTYYYEQFYLEMVEFVDCLKNDRDPPVCAVDGLKTIELIQEAYNFQKLSDMNKER